MIFPPGMQNALSVSLEMTFTSHFQPGASGRKIPVCGSMRAAIALTRESIAWSVFSAPFAAESALSLA